MVLFSTVIAYLLTFCIPGLIVGFGAMCGDTKTGSLLAYLSFMSFISYYIYKSVIPVWILVLLLIILSLLFVILYSRMFGGGDGE